MPAVVVLGAQWGDEGKGKVVDLYSQHTHAVVRYGGGANAGHTLVVDGKEVVLHLMPSGALHPNVHCVLGQGMVIDPRVVLEEIAQLSEAGLAHPDRLHIAMRAHLVLPHHPLVDALRETGTQTIGTTKRGIGPAYEDKAARRGLRVGDLLTPDLFRTRLASNIEAWVPVIEALGGTPPEPGELAKDYLELGKALTPYVKDTSRWLNCALKRGERILLEGAQGTLLDLDQGTYPYVTSSSVVAAGAPLGAGIAPRWVRRSIGITKAYTTRVGGGPFPTELDDDDGRRLQSEGREFGATTGRTRRCGWLDAVALRHAVEVNGFDELAITKLDILSGFDALRVCTAYEVGGERTQTMPWGQFAEARPVYEDLPGWREDIASCATASTLPAHARAYLRRIEELTDCRIGLVSIGADRSATIDAADPFLGL